MNSHELLLLHHQLHLFSLTRMSDVILMRFNLITPTTSSLSY
jgi:hypothetical protein